MGDQVRLVWTLFADAPNGITETMLRRHGVDLITLEGLLALGQLRVSVDRFGGKCAGVCERRFHFVRA